MGYDSLVEYKIDDEEEITVCGDIHGQYYDLMNIFALNGNPAINNKYLFNGDFVDRGSFSVECIMTLIAWKCVNKDFLHMTRGNHEAKQVNMIYGFKGEVEAKFKDVGVYEAFSEMFCNLPLSYVFNQRVMVCHGGLPTADNVSLADLTKIMRFCEPPEKGNMCDLLWADPGLTPGRTPSKRGVSMAFGPDVSKAFLEHNKLGTSAVTQIFLSDHMKWNLKAMKKPMMEELSPFLVLLTTVTSLATWEHLSAWKEMKWSQNTRNLQLW